jgi:internalin A
MSRTTTQLATLLLALLTLCLFSLASYAKQSQQDLEIINSSAELKLLKEIFNQQKIVFYEEKYPKILVNKVANKRSIQKKPFHKSGYRVESFNIIKSKSSSKEFSILAFTNIIIVNEDGKITHIALTHAQIKNTELIDKLSNFSHLKGLLIQNSEISGSKLSLKYLNSLEDLYLISNSISDVILPINSNLITIDLDSSPVSIIVNLKKQVNLNHLYLSGTKLQEIDDLIFSKKLLTLSFGSNRFKKIPSLINFPSLRYLNFNYASIEEIKGVGESKNLQYLKTSGKLKNIIESFPSSLISLVLSGDNYVKMPNIVNLNNLENLTIYGTKINKITNLENLVKLEELSLTTNDIKKIEGLDKLSSLRRLDLSNTEISKIEGLENLERLEELDLSMNKIIKVENVDHLSNIEYIKLSENPVEHYDLKSVEKISSHAEISLDDTPFYNNLKKSNKDEWKKLRRKGLM